MAAVSFRPRDLADILGTVCRETKNGVGHAVADPVQLRLTGEPGGPAQFRFPVEANRAPSEAGVRSKDLPSVSSTPSAGQQKGPVLKGLTQVGQKGKAQGPKEEPTPWSSDPTPDAVLRRISLQP